jgi:hypothetical protein
VHLPALLPAELYAASGRLVDYGDLLFRLTDRKNVPYVLGPTHEELFATLVKGEFSSYRDYPVALYQIQTKYRDEARPRAGILRGREFVMKDSYSFDLDDDGLRASYARHREAYTRIFDRLGFDYRIVSAVSGAVGLRGIPGPGRGGRGQLRRLRQLHLRGQRRGARDRPPAGAGSVVAPGAGGDPHPRHPHHRHPRHPARRRAP